MSYQTLTKRYTAGAAIAAYSLVKPGANDDAILPAAAATDALIGVVEGVAPTSGEGCDVVLCGLAEVALGGTVAAGDPITSNATARAVKAAPPAGVNQRICGFARQSGVAGDVIEVLLAPGQIQG